MAYTVRTTDNAGDLGRAADQNESVDNDDWLYANLQTEIASYSPDRPSASAGAASDEFNSTTLNVAWTAFGGLAAGSVTQMETGAVDKYDLSTFPGWLAMQTDNDATNAGVYKAWAPGTGPWSVVVKVGLWEGGSLETAKDQKIGIMVSDNTTPTNYTLFYVGNESGTWQYEASTQAGAIASAPAVIRGPFYLAMVRLTAGGSTQFWGSNDGMTWLYVGVTATATAVSYLWIYVRQDLPTVRPIYLCDFIRTFATATKICGRAGNT